MSLSARRKARSLACQAVYQWHMTQDLPRNIYEQFIEANHSKVYDEDYFSCLFNGVIELHAELDERLAPLMHDRSFNDLTVVEWSLLRIGAFELMKQPDVPAAVVMSEAIRLSKLFGATDGYRFVNAVLDRLAKQL